MILFNGSCDNRIYGNEKPVTCNECEGMLSGGFCFPCNLKDENSFIYDPNAYSFNNSNYFPQPQYENYLCNLYGNNSHDGYDCQQQFLFVYEQEPSYNQNYNNNYYPYDLPSFPYCDNYGESHETFQCQPMAQNIDFSCSDQIQTPQYPDVHFPSQETNLKELAEYDNSPSRDRFIFLNDDENHSVQNEESLENASNEIASNLNEEKEEPPQDSDIHQMIEECSTEVCEEQKHSMEDTMLELVKIFTTILSTKEPEYSTSMGYENPNTTLETESDEIIKSGVEELVPILSENKVTLEDKREYDLPNCENSPVCDNHFDIFSDFKIDDDISVYDDDFEDIEYVEASLFNPEIVSVEEENDVNQDEEEVDLEDISQIQDVDLREKLLSITRIISNIESLNDNPTPDCVLNSSVSIPIFEESDNSLSDTFSPEFETFCDHTKETKSGNTTHANESLPEYDSFWFEIEPHQERLINVMKNDILDDSSNDPLLEEADLFLASDNSIPPVPLPPPEPPDEEFDFGDEISVVIDKLEGIDAKVEFENHNYYFFMFDKVFSLLSAESEDTIFDPGISI
nr:hypothetical protein [Tanacetum cinerariifolium]